MSKEIIHIPKVYTFDMPDFGSRNKTVLLKASPELLRYLDDTVVKTSTNRNNLVNHFIWDGIKKCGGRLREHHADGSFDDDGMPILGDLVGRSLEFVVPYKRKNKYKKS